METALKYTYDLRTKSWASHTVNIKLGSKPFQSGGTRVVYRLREINGAGQVKECCAKFLDAESCAQQGVPVTRQLYFHDALMQLQAQAFAELYNARGAPKPVKFVSCWVLELCDRPGSPLCLIEPLLSGKYTKHNNNYGGMFSQRNTPQAFSHFTYEESGHELLVCDIQGVADWYTDPQIHTRSGQGFGCGNQGRAGIKQFFATHVCNDICINMGLPKIANGTLISPGLSQQKPPSCPTEKVATREPVIEGTTTSETSLWSDVSWRDDDPMRLSGAQTPPYSAVASDPFLRDIQPHVTLALDWAPSVEAVYGDGYAAIGSNPVYIDKAVYSSLPDVQYSSHLAVQHQWQWGASAQPVWDGSVWVGTAPALQDDFGEFSV